MLYLIRAHRRQQETRRTTAALEALLETHNENCRTLREGTESILAHLAKDEPDDSGNPR
ncbi:hypothetical protein [Streptomyces chartreusis]